MADGGRVVPNEHLRQARLRSASGSGRAMSRADLADAVNAQVLADTGIAARVDAAYIGRLERGLYRWPHQRCRAALRAVLRVAGDADLGFATPRPPGP